MDAPVAQLAEAIALRANKCGFESLREYHPIYKGWKIYGPYQSKDDLRRRIVAYDGTSRVTISYSKFWIECILGKELNKNEEVHHINGIEFDDRLENYQIVNGTQHRKEHQVLLEYFICPTCDNPFELSGLKLSNHVRNKKRRPNMKGPYCSRNCAGKQNN
jgi:hypothetical protein